MRVFVFESITGGGTFAATPGAPPSGSLLAEGRAMLTAVASDFARLPNTDVICLWDERLPRPDLDVDFVAVNSSAEEARRFDGHAANSDGTLLIAPELNGELLARTRRVEQLGGRLLSPDSRFVELTASKYKTTCCLLSAGVRVPPTVLYDGSLSSVIDFEPPLIAKPDDGAGSIGIQRFEHPLNAFSLPNSWPATCIQAFCVGRPASVSVLCTQQQLIPLPACWQALRPPRFEYTGGSIILDAHLAARAARLASQAVNALPKTRGLIGVDLILGDPKDGSADFAVEINPRLTTSYVGLRRACDQNLAHAMLSASKDELETLSFRRDRLEFSASGEVRHP